MADLETVHDTFDHTGLTGVGSGSGGGAELDYVQVSSGSVSVAGTSEGTATTIVTGTSFALDGSTSVMVEFFSPRVTMSGSAGNALIFDLYDGATILGRIAVAAQPTNDDLWEVPIIGKRRLATPSAANHQYIVKCYRTGTAGTVYGGAGGTGAQVPLYIRVTQV